MESARIDINRLIPHRPPMVMLDGFTPDSDTAGTAEKTFSRDDYGCEDGIVIQGMLIECVAQAVAAHRGYFQLGNGDAEAAMGMLVTIDHFDFFHPVPEDAAITIKVSKTDERGPFHLIRGDIFCRGKMMVSGRLKVFYPAGSK